MVIHAYNHPHTCVSSVEGHQHSNVSGRSTHPQGQQAVTIEAAALHTGVTNTSRMDDQSGEVGPTSGPTPPIHRGTVRHTSVQTVCPAREIPGLSTSVTSGTVREASPTSTLAPTIGTSHGLSICHKPRSTSTQTDSTVPVSSNDQTRHVSEDSNHTNTAIVPRVVDSGNQRAIRHSDSRLPSADGTSNGRVTDGMGCAHGRAHDCRNVEPVRSETSHQPTRNVGSVQSSAILGPETSRESHSHQLGQSGSSGRHKPAGDDQIGDVTQSDVSTLFSDRRTGNGGESSTHSRRTKRASGRPIKTRQEVVDRMVAPSRHIPSNTPKVRRRSNRPIRHTSESQVTTIRQPDPGPPGMENRRAVAVLGRPSSLRLSPASTPSCSSGQNQVDTDPTTSVSSAVVAGETLVSSAPRISARPLAITQKERPPQGQRNAEIPRQSRHVQLTRVEHIKRTLIGRGYSTRAAEAVVNAHRASTQSLYDKKWDLFTRFCANRKWSPMQIEIPQIGVFLVFLRDKRKLKGGTIATYSSAISTVLAKTGKLVPTKCTELQAIIKAFRLEDQERVFQPPQWDLNVVLQYLASDVFTPMDSIPLEKLTIKTVFLVGMATAARVGELHAIDVTRITFDVGRSRVMHLGLALDFVAKNQGLSEEARTFHIVPLDQIVGHQDHEDLSLCPVRAVKYYLNRTKQSRKQRKRLFLPLGDRKGEISKNSISFWLKSAILEAYHHADLQPPSSARPHELRAVSASMALHANISVQDIVKGCFWKGDTTFASHYLRDLSVEDVKGLRAFGPLVMAQQIVNPPRRRRRDN